MIIERGQTRRESLKLGLAILIVGVLLGSVVKPLDRLGDARGVVRGRSHDHTGVKSGPGRLQTPDNGLETLALDIAPEHAAVIQEVRDQAIGRRLIVQDDRHTVPATVTFGGRSMAAEVRLKGDWIDHVDSRKWSYRIRLSEGSVLGMRTFSIQSPHTRGYLWEWLILTMARRENVLAPRATYVNVVVNDKAKGVYLLEEHFRKEMLESMGRREGPIVRFDEGTLWDSLLDARRVTGIDMSLPDSSRDRAWHVAGKEISAFEERRLSEDPVLGPALMSAIEKMRALQRTALVKTQWLDKGRLFLELDALQATTIDDLMDTDRLAHAHALASLFRVTHSMIWHNMRFYHNPLLDRLEPILFDNMPHNELTWREPVMFLNRPILKQLATSPRYYNGVFRYLGSLCEEGHLEGLLEDVDDDLQRFAAALEAEHPLGERFRPDAMKQRLLAQRIYLRSIIDPADPINFSCFYEVQDEGGAPVSGRLDIEAWSTTWTPVLLEGFRFGNGRVVSAASCLEDTSTRLEVDDEGGVVLPKGGEPIRFRLSMDERLASLESVQQIKQAIREQTQRSDTTTRIALDAIFRPVAVSEARTEPLRFLKRDPDLVAGAGRPAMPTLEEALLRYPFLEFDLDHQRLSVRRSEREVEVEGDLVVPRGWSLYVYPGTTMRFHEGAALVSESALVFEGEASAQVVLEPADGHASWDGIVVLRSPGRSVWRHVVVRGTRSISRAGWTTTGGITFYHSPVTMTDCRVDGTRAEDGLNIYGARMELVRVDLTGCVSDSFDGDFVTGRIASCRFSHGGADGIDLSGSTCTIERCAFSDLADKAISIGEGSTVTIDGGVIERTALGLVCKDSSRVEVQGLEIRSVDRYALAAYVKKPEFGPSSIVAEGLTVGDAGSGTHLIQHGCSLELNGLSVATRSVDVKRLYREGVLGN